MTVKGDHLNFLQEGCNKELDFLDLARAFHHIFRRRFLYCLGMMATFLSSAPPIISH